MRWDIVGKHRVEMFGFTGINLCGKRDHVQIFPSGPKGDINGLRLQSIALVAPLGTRIILMTAASAENWQEMPWRAFEFRKGHCFKTEEGRWGIRVPDLDELNKPNAERTDPDFIESFDHVERLEDGTGWTYGKRGAMQLKNNIRGIRVERLPEESG